ncbi:hypothetical protein [Oceanobacillus timonensis]|uniref:hypothetical protein n=1 Tax=Oceanobacillus timonensis TaxID=1926285 RepID=UPI0015C464C1|nr:hypothetical protein [Oceanobacillus timonensis]
MDKTEKYLKSIDNSLKRIANALTENNTVTKDTPIIKGKPPDNNIENVKPSEAEK